MWMAKYVSEFSRGMNNVDQIFVITEILEKLSLLDNTRQ